MINRNTAKAVHSLRNRKIVTSDMEGALLIRDCVLMERFTGKSYTYTLYNFNTGEKKYIGHCKRQADENALKKIIPTLTAQTFFGTTIPAGEGLIRYIFTEVFSRYGYRVRSEQIDLSIKMHNAMKTREILLSDVAVGFGKTHAYLVAGIVYSLETQHNHKPIVVSTSSKELQRAIMDEYLPDISRMLLEHGIINTEVTAVLRKGKDNFICHKRLREYLGTIKREKKPCNQYQELVRLLRSQEIDLDKAEKISRYDRGKIKLRDSECKTCPLRSACPYQEYMQKAFENEFIFQICNHNYFTMDAKLKHQKRKPLLPQYKAAIIDEAHKLHQAAIQTYSTVIDFNQVETYMKDRNAKRSRSNSNKPIANLCKDIENTCREIRKLLFAQVSLNADTRKYTVRVTNIIRSNLLRLSRDLERANRLLLENKNFSLQRLRQIARNIDHFFEKDCIAYIERVDNKYVLVGVPTDIQKQIRRDLLYDGKGVVLTSGTLAVDNDFDYIKSLLGIKPSSRKVSCMVKESMFNYYGNSLVYTSTKTTYPNYASEIYFKTLAAEADRLIRVSNGHALVLFTSYAAMRTVCELLRKKSYPFPILKTNRGNGQAVTEFREADNAVLLGCGSMWEGVNFAGDKLSHLIITKLPFLIPDPITEYKRMELGSDEAYREQILLPQMLLKLKQGHGRAIRTETDTAVISILDSRVNSRYKAPVQNALPKCQYTSDIKDVRQFFRNKKTIDFFGGNEYDSARLN